MSATMISALKMMPKGFALCGLASFMMLRLCSGPLAAPSARIIRGEHAGMNGEVFSPLVGDRERGRAPRVISNCLPISTISISLAGWNQDRHVAGFARRLRSGIHRNTRVGRASAGRRSCRAAHLQPACRCPCSSRISLSLSSGSLRRIRRRRLRGDRRRRGGLSPVIITVRIPMAAQLGEALADAALDDVFQVDDAEEPAILATASGVPRTLRPSSAMALISRAASTVTTAAARARRR